MNKNYVNFRTGGNCDCDCVSLDDWNTVLSETDSKFKRFAFDKAPVYRISRYAGLYDVLKTDSYMEIRICSYSGCKRIRTYFNGSVEQHKSQRENVGMEAIMEVQRMAKSYNGGRYRSFKKVFVLGKGKLTQELRDAYRAIKKCVLSPFDYACDGLTGKRIMVNKADVSSAYGSTLQGKLPTLEGHKRVPGRVPPSEDYPFAYYINSHHLAVYGEFDSKDFLLTRFYNGLTYGKKWLPMDVPDIHEETILCKEETEFSDGFRKAIKEMYVRRNEDPDYKLYINACIGMLHLNKDPYCSHIAAVVYGRCINSMLKRCDAIQKARGVIALVNTDSISWIGPIPDGLCSTEKKMGSFRLEESQIPMIIKSVKCYQFIGSEGLVTRFAGIAKEVTEKLGFGDIMSFKEKGNTLVSIDGDRLEVKHA